MTIHEFQEKYGRLPTVIDRDWNKELARAKLLSKIQVVDMPMLHPGKCVSCGASSNDRKYIDLGVDLDPNEDPRFVHAIYICSICVQEIVSVAAASQLDPAKYIKANILSELIPPVADVQPVAGPSMEDKINDIHSFIMRDRSVDPIDRVVVVSESETESGSATVAESELGTDESDTGGRLKGVPSLAELVERTKHRTK
jgi:hypothetical protein